MGPERTGGRTQDSKQRRMKRVRKQRPVLRAMHGRASLGCKCPKVADAIQCPKGSLAEKFSLGISVWQSSRSSVILLQGCLWEKFLNKWTFYFNIIFPLSTTQSAH